MMKKKKKWDPGNEDAWLAIYTLSVLILGILVGAVLASGGGLI